ncbi:MAG: histidinol-phosphate transaminase [Gemmatimonadetes bacterium]|nr:histidinol-phosphate transaminase [Gemmatimonadota bacterium]
MATKQSVSRRGFLGGAAASLGYLGINPTPLRAERSRAWRGSAFLEQESDEYDAMAKLNFNENPYGPSEPVLEAMTMAFKYSMRYGYPDGGVLSAIAEHHGVPQENVMLGAGSGEILEVVGLTYLEHGKKVVGVEPSYGAVYRHASGIDAEAITLPLMDDYRQSIPALIDATKKHYRDVGFVYLCNPNNPTGRTVSAAEVQQLLDGIPEDVPVLIDEAYHHFVEDPEYATSIPHVLEGRPVIVTRTFSKLFGMAAMRLGFAIATPEIIEKMRPYSTGSINALVKWGAVAALQDTEAQERVRRVTLELRKQTAAELESMGYGVIPSETNFFMMHTGRHVREVQQDFRARGVRVGRAFPPMLNHLRVSIGTEDEMRRFMVAFKDIFPARTTAGSTRG